MYKCDECGHEVENPFIPKDSRAVKGGCSECGRGQYHEMKNQIILKGENGEPICFNHAVRLVSIFGSDSPRVDLFMATEEAETQPECTACKKEKEQEPKPGFLESYL